VLPEEEIAGVTVTVLTYINSGENTDIRPEWKTKTLSPLPTRSALIDGIERPVDATGVPAANSPGPLPARPKVRINVPVESKTIIWL
jgi:hypothetical protein